MGRASPSLLLLSSPLSFLLSSFSSLFSSPLLSSHLTSLLCLALSSLSSLVCTWSSQVPPPACLACAATPLDTASCTRYENTSRQRVTAVCCGGFAAVHCLNNSPRCQLHFLVVNIFHSQCLFGVFSGSVCSHRLPLCLSLSNSRPPPQLLRRHAHLCQLPRAGRDCRPAPLRRSTRRAPHLPSLSPVPCPPSSPLFSSLFTLLSSLPSLSSHLSFLSTVLSSILSSLLSSCLFRLFTPPHTRPA